MDLQTSIGNRPVRAIAEIDVFIIAVKGYDLDDVSRSLSGRAKKQTVFLPLLNGMDIVERMRRHIQNGIILPACVYVSAFIEEPALHWKSWTDHFRP